MHAKYYTYAVEKAHGLLSSPFSTEATAQLSVVQRHITTDGFANFPAFQMKSERTHRCVYCLQVIWQSGHFVLELPTTTTSKKESPGNQEKLQIKGPNAMENTSMHKDRNLIPHQAEILAIHFATFLSLQILGYYVYFVINYEQLAGWVLEAGEEIR